MDILETLTSLVTNPLFYISIIFWIVAFLIVKILGKKRSKYVSLFFPFLVLFRTQKFNQFFKKIAKKGTRGWRIFWNIGIIVSFMFMMFALYFFTSNLIALIVNPKPENAIIPLIPGVTIDLPMFSYLLLPILFVITIHECSHAIAAENDHVDVKSSGIFGAGLFFIIGFGAFVEVDEFQLFSRKYSNGTRLRVASAGVWSNIILAGLVLLILNFYPQMTSIGYTSESFRITNVLTNDQGGFNENNLYPGDIVLRINDTLVDVNKNTDLGDILDNKTNIKCSVGDQLIFTCWNPDTNTEYQRNVTLGHRSFIGFSYSQYNESALVVGEIYSTLIGGNNEGNIDEGAIITSIDDNPINYSNGETLERYLTNQTPNYKINLTSNTGKIYEINVNYYPDNTYGANSFYNVYFGISIQQISNNSFNITYSSSPEKIPQNIIITSINGTNLSLEEKSVKNFVEEIFSPEIGDNLIFTDTNGNNYTLNATNIPVLSVYIGITHESYWIPKNFIGRILGSNAPNWIYIELSFTWILAFSIALFNLMPASIFDGGRMMKEIIDYGVGNKSYKKNSKKKIRYEYIQEEPIQHLMEHGINQILSANLLNPIELDIDEKTPSSKKEKDSTQYNYEKINYVSLDTSNDGYIDSIEILDSENIENKRIIEVEIDYNQDLKSDIKKRIYRWMSIIVGALIITNFVISIIKFGSTFFWL